MGTTGSGYPYPEDGDPVAQGAQAIKDLAQTINTQLRATAKGNSATVNLTGTAVGNVAVTFPVGRFSTLPALVATTDNSQFFAAYSSLTPSGVTLWVRHYQGTNSTVFVTVCWIASS